MHPDYRRSVSILSAAVDEVFAASKGQEPVSPPKRPKPIRCAYCGAAARDGDDPLFCARCGGARG